MKKLLIAALLLLPVSAFAKETSSSLKYEGWSCAGCAGKVEKAVKNVKGVKTAKVTKDTISVTFDDEKTTLEAIKTAVNTTGETKGHFKVIEADAATEAPKSDAPAAETK